MVLQITKSWYLNPILLDLFNPSIFNTRAVLLLSLFLICEFSTTVQAKSVATRNTYNNVTIVSKAKNLYLTIGKQGITGEYSSSPYAKLEVETVGFNGEIWIKGVKMGKYLAMNSTGTVSLVAGKTKEAVFINLRKITMRFGYIKSKSYPSKYLVISGTGAVSGSTNKNSGYTKYAMLSAT